MKIIKLASILFLIFVLLSPQALAVLARGWGVAGTTVVNAVGNKAQSDPAALALGNGVTLVAWLDKSTGAYRLMAQKFSVNGAEVWTAGGVVICSATNWLSSQNAPQAFDDYIQIVSDGADGAILAWKDYRNNSQPDIYAQKINGSGVVQWTDNGLGVCTSAFNQNNMRMASDGGTGAILAWLDDRDGSFGSNSIYAQKINSSGAKQWGDSDLCIYNYSTGGKTAFYPAITGDGGGGAVIAWYDSRSVNGYEIYAQQAKTNGTVNWQANGITVCDVVGQAVEPSILNAGGGDFIIAWWDGRDGVPGAYDVYAQKIQAGVAAWAANGVAVTTSANYYLTPDMNLKVALVTDGAGGAIFAWPDYRNNTYGVFMQRLTSAGAAEWLANGVAVNNNCNTAYSSPRLVSDGSGGALVVWSDYRNNGTYDLYSQLVNSAGVVQWAANGLAVSTAATNKQYPRAVSDGAGGAVVIWKDGRADSTNGDVYGERVNGGTLNWGDKPGDNKPLNNSKGTVTQFYPAVTSDGAGGAVAVWMDGRAGSKFYDIYAQRYNSEGKSQWANDVAIAATANDEVACYYPSICQTSDGKFVIAWYDSGGVIYVQKMDNAGAKVWTSAGVKVLDNGAAYNGAMPVVASDGAGGVVIAYTVTAPAGMGMGFGALPKSNWLASAYLNDADLPDLDGLLLAKNGGGGVTKYQIYYKRVDTDGNIVTPYNNAAQDATTPGVLAIDYADDVNGQVQYAPSITKLDNTYAMLVFDFWRMDGANQSRELRLQKIRISDGVRMLADDDTDIWALNDGSVIYNPHIASTTDGKVWVTWMQSASYASHDYNVVAMRISGNGVQETYKNDFASTVGVDEIRPRVAINTDSSFFIVWQEGAWVYATDKENANKHPGTGTMADGQIYGQFFNSSGAAQGSKFKVFDTASNLEYPDVSITTSQGSDIVVADNVVTDNNDIVGQKVTGLTVAGGGAKPAAPTNLTGVAISPTAITWTWTDNAKDEAGFYVGTPVPVVVAKIETPNTTSYTWTKRSPNTAYSFIVAAYNSNGTSTVSNTAMVWTLASIPGGLSATLKAREITLAWTSDGTNDTVWRAPAADGPWTAVGVDVLGKSFNDTGLLPETTYWYKVGAKNGAGVLGTVSDPSSFKTGGASALAPQIGAGKHLKTNLAVAKSDHISSDGNLKFVFTDPNVSVGGKINYVKVVFLDAAGNEVAKKEYTEAPESIKLDSPLPPGTYTAKVYTTSSTGTSTEKVITDLKVSDKLEITRTPVVYPLAIARSSIKAQGVAATQVAYQLSKDGNVSMIIYGVDGQIVYRGDYVAGTNGGSAGPNAVSWDGYAHFTRAPAGRGLYFVQFIDRDSRQLLGKAVVHVQ
jgi:hypothetical protein